MKVIQTLKTENLNSTISLDLLHIRLIINTKLAFNNLQILAEAAKGTNVEVIISAEGTDRTDKILETFCKISPGYQNIGITLRHICIEHPMSRGDTSDDQYIWLIETLLLNNRVCSIATHHDKIQKKIKDIIKEHKIPKTHYEFEMLYGIREDLLKNLQQEGYPCRQYMFMEKSDIYIYVIV